MNKTDDWLLMALNQYSVPDFFTIYSLTVHPSLTILYCIVMYLIYKHSQDFSNPYYTLIKALAVADFIINIYMCIFSHITAQFWVSHTVGVAVSLFGVGYSYYASFILNVFIAVNRFFAVVFFAKFKIMMTKNLYYVFVFLSFFIAVGFATPFYVQCIMEAEIGSRFSFYNTGFDMCLGAAHEIALRGPKFSLTLVSLTALLYFITAAVLFKRRKSGSSMLSASYVKDIKLMFQGVILFVLICLILLSGYVTLSDWYILTCLYVTVNPILYLLCDTTLRNYFVKQFYPLKCFSKNSVSSVVTIRAYPGTN